MTRKDFVLLAADLADCRPILSQRSTREQRACMDVWLRTRAAIIAAYQRDNPSFNRNKFIEATEK